MKSRGTWVAHSVKKCDERKPGVLALYFSMARGSNLILLGSTLLSSSSRYMIITAQIL